MRHFLSQNGRVAGRSQLAPTRLNLFAIASIAFSRALKLTLGTATPAFIADRVDLAELSIGVSFRAMGLLRVLVAHLIGGVAIIELARAAPEVIRIAAVPDIAGMANVVPLRNRSFPEEVRQAVQAPSLAAVTHPGIAIRIDVSLPEPTAVLIYRALICDALLVVRI